MFSAVGFSIKLVERAVVELGDHGCLDHPGNDLKVLDHPGGRPVRLERPLEGNVEPIRVAVQARALPGVVRKHVRRLEREGLADLHSPGTSP